MRANARPRRCVRDVPIDVDVDDLQMGGWDADEVRKLFNFLEFRTLWDRLIEAVGSMGAAGGSVAPSRSRSTSRRRLPTPTDAVRAAATA